MVITQCQFCSCLKIWFALLLCTIWTLFSISLVFTTDKHNHSLTYVIHFNSQLSHSIMLNKSYGWIHWFGEYQQFHNVWTRFNIHWKVNAFWREDYNTSLWKIVFTQLLGLTTLTVVALLVASRIFKAFLAALLVSFRLNWPKRHLLIWPLQSWVTSSNCQDCCCQIFSLLRFFSLWWGISIKSPLRIVTKIVARDFSEILTDVYSLAAACWLVGGNSQKWWNSRPGFHTFLRRTLSKASVLVHLKLVFFILFCSFPPSP